MLIPLSSLIHDSQFTAPVFPVLAPLPVERTAAALAFFTFVRAFAQTWGLTISATVLQNSLKSKLPQAFLSQFPDGVEIAYAAIPLVRTLPDGLRQEVQTAFAESMIDIWKAIIGFSAAGLLSVGLMREVEMIRYTDERFGLNEGGGGPDVETGQDHIGELVEASEDGKESEKTVQKTTVEQRSVHVPLSTKSEP